jgi:hypothetical protein
MITGLDGYDAKGLNIIVTLIVPRIPGGKYSYRIYMWYRVIVHQ